MPNETVREQGGSVLSINSGGKLQINSGGSLQLNAGASLQLATSLGSGETTTPTKLFAAGKNWFWYAVSAACPVFSASGGDILWLANTSDTTLWLNVSDGPVGGSVWRGIGGLGSHLSFLR